MSSDDKKPAGVVTAGRTRAKRPAPTKTGELWAKCPECRMPVKDVELFRHLLKCPGAEVRQAEGKAKEAAAKAAPTPTPETPTAEAPTAEAPTAEVPPK